jgi:hypothetical protein
LIVDWEVVGVAYSAKARYVGRLDLLVVRDVVCISAHEPRQLAPKAHAMLVGQLGLLGLLQVVAHRHGQRGDRREAGDHRRAEHAWDRIEQPVVDPVDGLLFNAGPVIDVVARPQRSDLLGVQVPCTFCNRATRSLLRLLSLNSQSWETITTWVAVHGRITFFTVWVEISSISDWASASTCIVALSRGNMICPTMSP